MRYSDNQFVFCYPGMGGERGRGQIGGRPGTRRGGDRTMRMTTTTKNKKQMTMIVMTKKINTKNE